MSVKGSGKAQISIPEGEDLYREIRVDNVLADEHGERLISNKVPRST